MHLKTYLCFHLNSSKLFVLKYSLPLEMVSCCFTSANGISSASGDSSCNLPMGGKFDPSWSVLCASEQVLQLLLWVQLSFPHSGSVMLDNEFLEPLRPLELEVDSVPSIPSLSIVHGSTILQTLPGTPWIPVKPTTSSTLAAEGQFIHRKPKQHNNTNRYSSASRAASKIIKHSQKANPPSQWSTGRNTTTKHYMQPQNHSWATISTRWRIRVTSCRRYPGMIHMATDLECPWWYKMRKIT